MSAVIGKTAGDGSTDPARCAGDEGILVGKGLGHETLLLLSGPDRVAFSLFKISELPNIGILEIHITSQRMAQFIHPDLKDVPLASLLHALSDPARLAIVRCLSKDQAEGGVGLSCNAAATDELPRATMSNHFTLLRSAGLIESRKQGVMVINRLRRDEIDARFPGLLDAILGATERGL